VQRDAEALAWECLRQRFRPEPVTLEAAVAALGGTDAGARLEYLEGQLRILHRAEPARDRLAFTLDPLAEYLAALYLVHHHGDNAERWREFVAQASSLRAAGETITGFLLAVRECCQARKTASGVPALLDEQLARAA